MAKLEVLSKSHSEIEIRWNVESSEALHSVVLERSCDGLAFAPIKAHEEINSKNSRKTFLDTKPNSGLNIYRLRMIDLAGNVSHSASQVVRIVALLTNATVYPNPCGNLLNISFSPAAQTADIEILNLFGQPLRQFKSVANGAGLDLSNIPAGHYFLQIQQEQKKKLLAFTRL
jgi:hypothetical protein